MKILIIGHTGFVGSHLCESMKIFAKISTSSRNGGDYKCDFSDIDMIKETFKTSRFDIVICAAVSYSSKLKGALDNSIIAANIIDYFASSVKQIIFISSVSADSANKYNNIYNLGKYIEGEVINYYRMLAPNICVLRFCQIIDRKGGSKRTQSGFHYIVDSINEGTEVNIFSKNDSPRSYISIGQVCDVVKYSVEKQIFGIHNIVLYPTYSLCGLVSLLISEKENIDLKINYLDKEALHYYIPEVSNEFLPVISQFNITDYLKSFVR